MIICGIIFGISCIGFGIYVYLYYPRTAKAFEVVTPNPTKKILIATQSSDFKDNLVAILCDSLKSSSSYIQGIDISALSRMNYDNWDKILIINTFMIRLDSEVERYVNRVTSPGKSLLIVTSGGADWLPPSEFKIDALSSASNKENISELIRLITDWLHKDSHINWKPKDYVLALKFLMRIDTKYACTAIANRKDYYQKIYPNLERLINRIGYNYLRLENVPSAVEIFRLNVSLFPDSWNAYDSYGEALNKAGNLTESIKNYKQALKLNPESKHSKDMLEKINNN